MSSTSILFVSAYCVFIGALGILNLFGLNIIALTLLDWFIRFLLSQSKSEVKNGSNDYTQSQIEPQLAPRIFTWGALNILDLWFLLLLIFILSYWLLGDSSLKIILLSLGLIRQDIVGLVQFYHVLLAVLAQIRIIVVRQRVVVVFDLFGSGIGRDLEYFIVIHLSSNYSSEKVFGLFASSKGELCKKQSAQHLLQILVNYN